MHATMCFIKLQYPLIMTPQFAFISLAFLFASCSSVRPLSGKSDNKLQVTFVQVNDVYEIAPLSGGREGGMARVASLKKQELKKNPNTFLVMCGDFLSPSVYNSLRVNGQAVRGAQMIESMNASRMDLAVFGNHEFDIKESELQDRINESRFRWVATNTFHKTVGGVQPFEKNGSGPIPKTWIQTLKDLDGTEVRIGYLGLTLSANRAEYVSYSEPFASAKEAYNALKDSVDAVVAVTHQAVADDIRLAKELPELALILGGHEHDQRFHKVGRVFITKAHANARSAYVVTLKINTKKNTLKATPRLVYLDEKVPLDSATTRVVNKWMDMAEKNYSSLGFEASKVVLSSGEPLDGREAEMRYRSTNLSRTIVRAMQKAAPVADVVMFNSGSVRVDDILPMPLTQYDIIRTLPFGGGIQEVDMKGALLIKVLEAGKRNAGNGGFLQYNENLFNDGTHWKLNGSPLDPVKTYRVALTDYLITGKETGLDFLEPKNKDIVKVYGSQAGTYNLQSDIRLAIIRYLESEMK